MLVSRRFPRLAVGSPRLFRRGFARFPRALVLAGLSFVDVR